MLDEGRVSVGTEILWRLHDVPIGHGMLWIIRLSVIWTRNFGFKDPRSAPPRSDLLSIY